MTSEQMCVSFQCEINSSIAHWIYKLTYSCISSVGDMMKIAFATGENGEFAKGGELPWGDPIKNDMRHYVAFTKNTELLMGYKTWESLPEKTKQLYQSRTTLILSRIPETKHRCNFVVCSNRYQFIRYLELCQGTDTTLIGGCQYIKWALDEVRVISEILHTKVNGTFPFSTHHIDTTTLQDLDIESKIEYDDCTVTIYRGRLNAL